MPKRERGFTDGPASPLFTPVRFSGSVSLARLAGAGVSKELAASAAASAPRGDCVLWGIPFRIEKTVVVGKKPVMVKARPFKAPWLVFLHVSDSRPVMKRDGTFRKPVRGLGWLGEHAADYFVIYDDGSEIRVPIRRRHEIGMFNVGWGEDCTNAVRGAKPISAKASLSQKDPNWGRNQTRVTCNTARWPQFLYAWRNPRPGKRIVGFRFEPRTGAVLVSAVSAGRASSNPLRWRTRRKAVLTLPRGEKADCDFDESGLMRHLHIDLGQIISATPRPVYPNATWARTYNNKVPRMSDREILVEYTSHEDARFHMPSGRMVAVSSLVSEGRTASLAVVPPSSQRVTLEVREKSSGALVAVKLHVHGGAGEYLAPIDRHRIPNFQWFEDYSADYSNQGIHHCTYIPGRTVVDLPLGRVYVEVSKGFEIRPVRKVLRIGKGTRRIVIDIEKVLPWREKGWVTADTHVHFLSPQTALLEGAGEGVNVVNLLASQWGELMTNVGDFDGRTTFGSHAAGGDGEYLVRVGTENRQRTLGHISLLGYTGDIIAPMTTGGPDESAIGDPVGNLLTEWAIQCKKQKGVVVLPHFPGPRLENAASIITGNADAVEMSSRTFLYRGINPYSLLDWYRYLNCGYHVAIAGGTDKMEAETAVGILRTYAKLDPRRPFTYDAWKDAMRRGHTFVTCGPLIELEVEGKPAGSRIRMPAGGGTVDVTWRAASVTMPMSRVELIVNGEIRESRAVRADEDAGSWRLKIDRSSWVALLVRAHYRDKPEIVAAHTSAVMCEVTRSPFFAAADAVTILEQVEGALAFIDTIGTRAETRRYKAMRALLTSAAREIHNRLHAAGHYHEHTPAMKHKEHN